MYEIAPGGFRKRNPQLSLISQIPNKENLCVKNIRDIANGLIFLVIFVETSKT